MPRNILISLEGNIGSGKSTLLSRLVRALGEQDGITVLPEPVEVWAQPLPCLGFKSMLQMYYADGRANSFAFQMFVLKTRLDQILGVPEGDLIFSERCMLSHDAIFASGALARGDIHEVEWVTYRGWIDSVSHMGGERRPQGVVYLRTSPATCSERRQRRDRGAERDLPESLINDLHLVHEAFIDGLVHDGVPLLVIDGDLDEGTVDAVGQDHVTRILQFVQRLKEETHHDTYNK